MKIAVVGTGYVGLVTGTCLADYGNDVICVDVMEEKIENLKKGIIPIYEPGLEGMVLENYQSGRLDFTTDIQRALQKSDICFIAVGTPMGEDGSADLQYVLGVAESIGKYMDHHIYVIDKSTVPVGTAKKVRETIQKELDKRQSPLTFDVISNPEFLKEGTAVEDCSSINPLHTILKKRKSGNDLSLYRNFTKSSGITLVKKQEANGKHTYEDEDQKTDKMSVFFFHNVIIS